MAFRDYRNPQENSITRTFDIERFAHDVFAYILRICGLSEAKIPTSSLKENTYIADDFVKNVGLSALPIALYMRDDWKIMFKRMYEDTYNKIHSVSELQLEFDSMLLLYADFEDVEIISKLQFSLAFYTEFTLFLSNTVVESYIECLPKLWSRLCKQLKTESEDCEQSLEPLFRMYPEITEPWITSFIKEYAIPYGSSDDIADKFSLYAFKYTQNVWPEDYSSESLARAKNPKESTICHPVVTSNEPTVTYQPENANSESFVSSGKFSGSPKEPQNFKEKDAVQTFEASSICQPAVISDDPTVTYPTENAHSGLYFSPEIWDGSSRKPQNFKEMDAVQTLSYGRATNGLSYVVKQCIKKRKRSTSPKLVVEEEFEKMDLEKENVSPENRYAKRKCQISGKETIE